jgi:hypothetical protein
MPSLPGDALLKGIDTGSNMFAKMMHPIIQREQLAQQMKIHKDSQALQQAASARAASLAPLHKMMLEQQILKLKNSNDPMYEINNLKKMMEAFGEGGAPQTETMAKDMPSYIPSIGQQFGANPNNPLPDDPIQESQIPSISDESQIPSISDAMGITTNSESVIPGVHDAMGAGSMQGQQNPLQSFIQSVANKPTPNNANQIPQMNPAIISEYDAANSKKGSGGIDMEAIKKSPILRGWFKKKFGFDPGAPVPETPEEKLQNQIRLHQANKLFDIEHPTAGKENALRGPARDAADLARLKQEAGEDSEVYRNAKAAYDATLDAKKDLRDLRARTKAGLKVGEKEFFDEKTGEPLGKEIPLTAKEREAEEGNILFNEFYPYVYKGGAPFSGEGSIGRLQQAAANYKTDPKARELFDNLLLSDKAIAATTVNEASTLKAGKTNTTYKMLKESLEAQDIPKMIKKVIKEYGVPPSAQLKAGMRYQKLLSDARKKARKGTPATQKYYYNPERQAQYEQEQLEGTTDKKETKVINGVTYYPDDQGGWEHD